MTRTYRFNTGRPYSHSGQEIYVRHESDGPTGTATFADVTRGVDGRVYTPGDLLGEAHLLDYVLALYDRGDYVTGPETLAFMEECRRLEGSSGR